MKEPVHEQTEGPYYKKDSPERIDIVENGTKGEKLVVEGRVLDKEGRAIAGAWIDFWQADGKGEYDNNEYKLRGHQHTDETGSYRLETVVPAMYGSRAPHIHVKLQANQLPEVITTQLYFPDENSNKEDPLFDQALVLSVDDSADGKRARYDFVLGVD